MNNPSVESNQERRVSRIPNVRSMESFSSKHSQGQNQSQGRLKRRQAASLADLSSPSIARPQPGILIQSRRASVIRRKSLDNSKLLDAHVAR